MANNLFLTQRSSIPKSDGRVSRVDFTESQVGARKKHLPKLAKRPEMSIVHVKGQ